MLHWFTLREEQKSLLNLVVEQMPLQGSYLAGGTALALIIGHRESVDFDWFSPTEFDPESLARQLSLIKPFKVNEASRGTLHGIMDNVRVSWFYYPNPLLDSLITSSSMPGLKLASLKDIGTMKLIALSHRGSAKDFIDLYKLHENGLDLESLLKLVPSKFPGTKINFYHIIKSLSYFDDAEAEPMPRMQVALNWADLKKFFLKEQSRLLEKIDQF
ncbi:MAG: nucleotidyl transferase AbiEii/AbiGii toxin family protein [Bacillota bacterium]